MTNHYLSTLIWRLPPILIIHLKRFQLSANGYIKIQSNVEYPITDLGQAIKDLKAEYTGYAEDVEAQARKIYNEQVAEYNDYIARLRAQQQQQNNK